MRVYEHRKDSKKHEADYNISLLKHFVDGVTYEKRYSFGYSQQEVHDLQEKLEQKDLSLSDKYIIVHAGSGGSAHDWSPENFSVYIISLLEKLPEYKIVLTGIESEIELTNKIQIMAGNPTGRLLNLAGYTNLRELLILIDNCRLFVSNSTGPIHIAGALNKKIIGLFPSDTVMSKTRWKPLSHNVAILESGADIEMDSILPEKVYQNTRYLLEQPYKN